jgi:hypothetical protein
MAESPVRTDVVEVRDLRDLLSKCRLMPAGLV